MKSAAFALLATLILAPALLAGPASAKSVKWYCVALDPATPWIQTCFPSTSRP